MKYIEREGYNFPETWSETACKILKDKYMCKAEGEEEKDAREVFGRLVSEWGKAGLEHGYFDSQEESLGYQKKMFKILEGQFGAPNSPQFFNVGLKEDPEVSACYIQSVDDSLEGMMELWGKEAAIFKSGAGTGTNFSNIRAKGAKISKGGTSSGLMSFLKVGDASAGAIKSGGTTRRSAKMVIVNDDHPDVLDFIEWKVKEQQKAEWMVAGSSGKLDMSWQGEAINTISGQNSNNSVRISDGFMERLKNGDEKAGEIWDAIAEAAWKVGDPGIQFDGHIQSMHTTPGAGRINASNPCAEYLFLDETSCVLASMNLMKFLDGDEFNFDRFKEHVRLWTMTLDISISMAGYPTDEIKRRTQAYRPIGLGYANLGGLLMAMGHHYDSYTARTVAANITQVMTETAYQESGRLAEKLGAYEGCGQDMDKVLLKHRIYSVDGPVRNSQISVLAPTGTIGLLMDCETLGMEPLYSIGGIKTLAGGGHIKFDNVHLNEAAIATAVGKHAISPEAHVRMVAALQPFVSGGISKTVNLPNSATVEDIKKIHQLAYDLGVKCISVYRDGCKDQPMKEAKKDDHIHVKCQYCGSMNTIPAGSCWTCLSCNKTLGGCND